MSTAEQQTNARTEAAIAKALSVRQAHEIETGCSRRLPCRDCDEDMRRLWYGGEDE